MDTSNIKPNSHRYREEQKRKQEREKVEKVISGSAKTKKKNAFGSLISEDASNVKSYIFSDVLMPALQKLVVDIVKDGIDIVIYGGTRRNRDKRDSYSGNYISYSRFSDRDSRDRNYDRPRYQPNEIILDSRTDAEEVLDTLEDMIERYDDVSVATFYELVGLSAQATHADENYGWTNLANARIDKVRDGYCLRMPRVRPLD